MAQTPDNPLKIKVQERLDALGINAFEAAARMERSRTFVYDIVKGNKASVGGAALDALADALETTPEWLIAPMGTPTPERAAVLPNARHAPTAIPPVASMPKDVPVYGTASGSVMGSSEGAWQITADPVDWVRRPPALAANREAYALYVENTSMSPKYEPGDLVFVNPSRPVRAGDVVIVQSMRSENDELETYIKFLVRRANGDVICRQLSPDAEITFPHPTVKAVHRVLSPAELFGV